MGSDKHYAEGAPHEDASALCAERFNPIALREGQSTICIHHGLYHLICAELCFSGPSVTGETNTRPARLSSSATGKSEFMRFLTT